MTIRGIGALIILTATTLTTGVSAYFASHSPSSQTAQTCFYQAAGVYPDPSCTPGVVNKQVTQSTIDSTICLRGWTRIVRPPPSVTEPEKRRSLAQYGVSGLSAYEYDHLISLELGGAPNDTRNMWPEPHYTHPTTIFHPITKQPLTYPDLGSYTKDSVENALNRAVCSRRIPLRRAQYWEAHDWPIALPLVHNPSAHLPVIPNGGVTP